MATIKANKAIDSVKANPNKPIGNKSLLAEGLRAIEEINVEKIFPSAKPTPSNANVAMPAPIIFAAPISIYNSFLFKSM